MCILSVETASCHRCGAYKFEVTPRFTENLCTPGMYIENELSCSSRHETLCVTDRAPTVIGCFDSADIMIGCFDRASTVIGFFDRATNVINYCDRLL